jgi:hypothetical protein
VNQLLLCSAGLDRKVFFYDVNDGKVIKAIPAPHPLNCVAFLDDGVTVAVGTTQGQVLSFDLRTGSAPTAEVQAFNGSEVRCIAFQATRAPAKGSSAERHTVAVSRTIAADVKTEGGGGGGGAAAALRTEDLNLAPSAAAGPVELFSPLAASLPSVAELKSEAQAAARLRSLQAPLVGLSPVKHAPHHDDLFSPLPGQAPEPARNARAATAATASARAAASAGAALTFNDLFSPVGPVAPQPRATGAGAGGGVFDTPAAAPLGAGAGRMGAGMDAFRTPAVVPSAVAAAMTKPPLSTLPVPDPSPLPYAIPAHAPGANDAPVTAGAALPAAAAAPPSFPSSKSLTARSLDLTRVPETVGGGSSRAPSETGKEERDGREGSTGPREGSTGPSPGHLATFAPTRHDPASQALAPLALSGDLLRGLLEQTIDVFRLEMHAALGDLHLEVVRQFETQREEFAMMLRAHEEQVERIVRDQVRGSLTAPPDTFGFYFDRHRDMSAPGQQ